MVPAKAVTKNILLKAINYNVEQGTSRDDVPLNLKIDKDIVLAGIRRQEKDISSKYLEYNDEFELNCKDFDIYLSYETHQLIKNNSDDKSISAITSISSFYYRIIIDSFRANNINEFISHISYLNWN